MTDATDRYKDPAHREGFYHPTQITVHWMIVFLVLFQFLSGGGMEEAFDGAREGTALGLSGTAWVHGLIGTSIGLLMLFRLWARRAHPIPPPPESEPHALQYVSRGVHYAFYALLIGLPVLGLLAVLTGIGPLAGLHALGAWVLLILVVLHFAGAMWHAFRRDGVVKRMLRQDPAGQYDTATDAGGVRIARGEGQT